MIHPIPSEVDWLALAAQQTPDVTALVADGRTWTFGDLHGEAAAVASALARNGIRPGDRVAFSGERTPTAVAAAWGIPRAGAAAVVLDPHLPPADAMRQTRESGVRAVWHPLGAAWRVRREDVELPGAGPPDPGADYVVFTSGSGGRARGVRIDGASIAAAVEASASRLGNGRADRWLCVLPLHHVGGLSILWRSAFAGSAVVLEESFDAARVAALMSSGEVTVVSLVPTMLRRVLEAHSGPYRGLRAVLVGGGPLDPELLQRALSAGIPALETYGTTETCSQIATTPPEHAGRRPGCAGPPLDGVEVQIVDDADRPMPAGREGRIRVRGPMVTPGYLDGDRLPASAWLATGDRGYLDREGWLWVAGRADDVIVTGGENVVPQRVADVLGRHRGVRDIRIFGEDDPEWGRAVVAEIVLAEGTDLGDVRAWARSHLAAHEVPKRWRVVPAIDRGWKSRTG